MMQLLAKITKYAIDMGYITYDKLFIFDEEDLFSLFNDLNDSEIVGYINEFKNIKKRDIPVIEMPSIKVRDLNPLVDGKRYNYILK